MRAREAQTLLSCRCLNDCVDVPPCAWAGTELFAHSADSSGGCRASTRPYGIVLVLVYLVVVRVSVWLYECMSTKLVLRHILSRPG